MMLNKTVSTLLLLGSILVTSASAGVWEPLSDRESIPLFDFSAMAPTPTYTIPVDENDYGHYTINSQDWYRDEIPHTDASWYDNIHVQGSGVHTSSASFLYFDYSDDNCYHDGSCLTMSITGGSYAGGTEITSKAAFIDSSFEYGDGTATGTYFYCQTNDVNWTTSVIANVPFAKASPDTGHYNRMTYYFLPAEATSVFGSSYPRGAHNIGPRNDISGSAHFYYRYYLNGGGWWHVQMDTHPHHANDARTNYEPMGENYLTNMPTFFDTLSDFYIMQVPLNGYETDQVPYKEYISPFIFWEDVEPQNEETLLGLATMWNMSGHFGEIGFEAKYLSAESYGLYELRYSFTPVTNANWGSATPVHIREYAPFHIDARTDGVFIRPIPSYGQIWARFDLASQADEDTLEAGSTIYYAVKDIGQDETDSSIGKTGTDCLGTYYSRCGTDYVGTPDSFDYATDETPLTLIKRISYTLPAAKEGPIRSNLGPLGGVASGTTSLVITATTDVPSTCTYGSNNTYGIAYPLANSMTDSSNVHTATVSGLAGDGVYSRAIRCAKDSDGEVNDSDVIVSWKVAAGEVPTFRRMGAIPIINFQ